MPRVASLTSSETPEKPYENNLFLLNSVTQTINPRASYLFFSVKFLTLKGLRWLTLLYKLSFIDICTEKYTLTEKSRIVICGNPIMLINYKYRIKSFNLKVQMTDLALINHVIL